MTRHLHRCPTGQFTPTPPEPCIDCGTTMLGQYAYYAVPEQERAGYVRHHGGGRCLGCYRIHRGDTAGHEGTWNRYDLVDEWEFLATQGHTRRAAARRLRVSYAALCKAIERVNRERVEQTEEAAA